MSLCEVKRCWDDRNLTVSLSLSWLWQPIRGKMMICDDIGNDLVGEKNERMYESEGGSKAAKEGRHEGRKFGVGIHSTEWWVLGYVDFSFFFSLSSKFIHFHLLYNKLILSCRDKRGWEKRSGLVLSLKSSAALSTQFYRSTGIPALIHNNPLRITQFFTHQVITCYNRPSAYPAELFV